MQFYLGLHITTSLPNSLISFQIFKILLCQLALFISTSTSPFLLEFLGFWISFRLVLKKIKNGFLIYTMLPHACRHILISNVETTFLLRQPSFFSYQVSAHRMIFRALLTCGVKNFTMSSSFTKNNNKKCTEIIPTKFSVAPSRSTLIAQNRGEKIDNNFHPSPKEATLTTC